MSKIKTLYDSKFEALHDSALSGDYNDLVNTPSFGDIVTHDASEFASAAQGALADTAVQHNELATVATSGNYNDLTNRPSFGTAATHDASDFATSAQGAKADNSVQLASVPVSATAPGAPGMYAYNADWVYFCVNVNTWVRIPTSDW